MDGLVTMDKKYRTRNGGQVRILCTDREDQDYPVVALVKLPHSLIDEVQTYSIHGRHYGPVVNSRLDLIEVDASTDGTSTVSA